MAFLEDEKLSRTNPVVEAFKKSMGAPVEERNKIRAAKKALMRGSFLRNPLQAGNAADSRVFTPQPPGRLSQAGGVAHAEDVPGQGARQKLLAGGNPGSLTDTETPHPSKLTAAGTQEPQMMSGHKIGTLPKDYLQQSLAKGSGRITIGNTGETAEIDGSGAMKYFDASGAPMNKLSQKLSNYPVSNGGRPGNLDVEFGDSVSPEARKKFMENPVRPTAQIDRYNARQALAMGGTGGATASNRMAQIQKLMPQEQPELISYETNPNMDWRQAAAINEARTKGFSTEKATAIRALSDMGRADIVGQHGMDQVQQRGTNQLATSKQIGGNSLAQIGAQGAETRKTNNQKPAPASKQTYVQPEFDLQGKKLPGTGVWTTAPTPVKKVVPGKGFDPVNPSPENRAYLQNLHDTGQYDALERIEKQFGL